LNQAGDLGGKTRVARQLFFPRKGPLLAPLNSCLDHYESVCLAPLLSYYRLYRNWAVYANFRGG
jgi:hypothetical protein